MDIWLGQLDEVNDSQKWHAMEWQREWERKRKREWEWDEKEKEKLEPGRITKKRSRTANGLRNYIT